MTPKRIRKEITSRMMAIPTPFMVHIVDNFENAFCPIAIGKQLVVSNDLTMQTLP